jgi:hypothetical protein
VKIKVKVKVMKRAFLIIFLNEGQGHPLTPFYLNMNSNVNFVLFTTIHLLKMSGFLLLIPWTLFLNWSCVVLFVYASLFSNTSVSLVWAGCAWSESCGGGRWGGLGSCCGGRSRTWTISAAGGGGRWFGCDNVWCCMRPPAVSALVFWINNFISPYTRFSAMVSSLCTWWFMTLFLVSIACTVLRVAHVYDETLRVEHLAF